MHYNHPNILFAITKGLHSNIIKNFLSLQIFRHNDYLKFEMNFYFIRGNTRKLQRYSF